MKNIKYLNAGAGSGKTYFLTNSLAEHVENGDCTLAEVIMTTFSEKAATDIRRNARIRFLDKAKKNPKMYEAATELDAANIGTVHAVAYKYIKKYWYLLGISAECEVMTDDNKTAYIAKTLGEQTNTEDIAAFRRYAETMDLKLQQSSKFDYDFWRGAVAAIISKADGIGVADLEESRLKSLELIGKTCRGNAHYDLICECADRIFKIAASWRTNFEKYKKDNSIIEYNDMENYFLAMLKEGKYRVVQDEIRQSIKYVFVDEFQDSNPKQLEIFDRLSDLVTKSYWVGDPKQAIYGFRECDTNLVQALTDNIRRREKDCEPGFETGTLDVSRRSLKPLVEFTNDVFVKVFNELDSRDVVLLPTHRTESLPDSIPNIQHWDGPLKPNKSGTLISPNKGETITALASEIRRILDGRLDIRQVFDKDTRELRDIKPSDIAILCRTNGEIKEIADELEKYRIPVVRGSKAEATRLEIRLVLLMLNYILGEKKLLTAELSKICCGLSLSDILGKEYDDIKKITSVLDRYRSELSDKGVASIVRGFVIRMNLLNTCARWGEAERRRDNLMALMQNARDYEANCLSLGVSATLEGFISQVQDGGVGVEGYAAEGVNILTYHGSKGLQWPVVFLFSLTSTHLSDSQVAKDFLYGVNPVRKGTPTADNLYPGYYITYVPRMGSGNSKLPDNIRTAINGIKGIGNYSDFSESRISEGRRLLYVGVTRARDILIEVGLRAKKSEFLAATLGKIHSGAKWDAKTDKNWADGTMQEIWGPGTPKFYYREMEMDDAPEVVPATTYNYLPETQPCTETVAKRVSPSSLSDENLVEKTSVVCLNDDGHPFPQFISKAKAAEDNIVGTCIHNIFAAYDPECPRSSMVELAAACIERHGLKDVLTSPDAVISSIESLCEFLENTYGKAIRIEHELPFREIIDGQMLVGSIDLVWFTTETDCVLVDFKNLPGAGRSVLDPDDSRYLGHYAPQQKAYREALTRSGLTVRASIIYLSMQKKVISLNR
mgnify:CR=1 FL=1